MAIGMNQSNLNILHLRSGFEDNGPGSQSLTIATELRRRGHQVEFAAGGGVMSKKIIEAGFGYTEMPHLARTRRTPLNFVKAVLSLRRLISHNGIDIIHAHNAATALTAYIAQLFVTKRVRVLHSVRGIELRPDLRYRWRNWIYRMYPPHIFAVSQFTKRELIKIGARSKDITVTYNGVDLEKFNMTRISSSDIREEFNIPAENIVLGHVGAMSTNTKGQHILIQAFSDLLETHKNITLVIVGDGKCLSEFKELATSLGVSDHVIFTGRRFDIPKLQAAFDIFCLTSIWGEMFPNAILEAMAMGNPWVGSAISGLPELTVDGRGGIVVPPGDVPALRSALESLIISKSKRVQMGRACYEDVSSRLTIEKVVDTVEQQYFFQLDLGKNYRRLSDRR